MDGLRDLGNEKALRSLVNLGNIVSSLLLTGVNISWSESESPVINWLMNLNESESGEGRSKSVSVEVKDMKANGFWSVLYTNWAWLNLTQPKKGTGIYTPDDRMCLYLFMG
jgi:hypothetical protein